MNEYNEAMASEYSFEYWLSRHDLHNDCSMSDCVECVKENEAMNEQTENKLIEVRVKHLDNVMMDWKAIKFATIWHDELPTIKRFLAQHHSICEIRWNYVGSLQGHYEGIG